MGEAKSVFHLIEDENESLSFAEKYETEGLLGIDLSLNDLPYEFENSVQNFLSKASREYLEDLQIELYVLKTADYEHLITCDAVQKKVFIVDFFYSSLSHEAFVELKLYLCVLQTHLHPTKTDLLLDLEPHRKEFLLLKTKRLNEEVKDVMSLEIPIHVMGLSLIYLYRSKLPSLSHLERKMLRELISNAKLKKILNLRDNAFDYIKNGELDHRQSMEQFRQFERHVQDHSQDIVDYVENRLSKKRILIWFWWTVSPFLTKDTSFLLDVLSQETSIERVYIDLPLANQDFFDRFFRADDLNEDDLERHIKDIYPPFFDEYQKETILYASAVKKLKNLSKSFYCTGQMGYDLLKSMPFINESLKLEFPDDRHWLSCISNELNQISSLKEREIVLFIQFLKPVFKIPPLILDEERVETLMHVDQFTGFSPYEPSNSIASFSFHTSKKESFVLTDVNKAYFHKEPIIYIPEEESEIHPIDHSKFNCFSLYKTLLYSFHSNGGGKKSPQTNPTLRYQH